MSSPALSLREFIRLAQRDVQQVIEYLASPEARRMAPDAPAAVIATVGRLKLVVPVTYGLVGRPGKGARPPGEAPPPAPAEAAPEAPAVLVASPPPEQRPGYELVVATPDSNCQMTEHVGKVEIEFITCPKQYGT